jgi:choline dehydrogenase-like flavoprotein
VIEIDLRNAVDVKGPVRSRVCIVGGGIAGIVLAHRLSELAVDVVLLEAGGPAGAAEQTPQAVLMGQTHEGTISGRSHVLGGTSVRWGGQLLPLPDAAHGWPITSRELAPFERLAERLLGVDAAAYAAQPFFAEAALAMPALLDAFPGGEAMVSKWTPFARRNLAATLGRQLKTSPHTRVYLHAQVTELVSSADGRRVNAALVRAPGGGHLRFEAEQFVVAAGTVETVRLLLASRAVAADGVGNQHGQVGRNFHDHLTLPAGVAHGQTRTRLLRELRPWILKRDGIGRMGASVTAHSVKLVASQALCAELGINQVLAHMTIDESQDSGAGALRQMLRTRQHEGLRSAVKKHGPALPRAAVDACLLLWSAEWGGRRFVSKRARVALYLNAAQDVPSGSRITLAEKRDAAGMPLPIVDWHVTQHEIASLRLFAAWLRRCLDAIDLREIAWEPALFHEGPTLPMLDDARHAMGGALMGHDPHSSVVDAQLGVHGMENLSIASAAVFPSGAPPLPTLPLMALALRLADRLVRRVSS